MSRVVNPHALGNQDLLAPVLIKPCTHIDKHVCTAWYRVIVGDLAIFSRASRISVNVPQALQTPELDS